MQRLDSSRERWRKRPEFERRKLSSARDEPCCMQPRNARIKGAIIVTQMASALQINSLDAIRRIQRVQTVTIAWMSVEAMVSLFAAWRARSPALLAFDGDSAIELFSAVRSEEQHV